MARRKGLLGAHRPDNSAGLRSAVQSMTHKPENSAGRDLRQVTRSSPAEAMASCHGRELPVESASRPDQQCRRSEAEVAFIVEGGGQNRGDEGGNYRTVDVRVELPVSAVLVDDHSP